MTETAEKTETLEQFRAHVRTVAIRVAKENGWCDDGLNEVLQELGLPMKKNFLVRVRVNGNSYRVRIDDVQTQDEADATVAENPEKIRSVLQNYDGYYFPAGTKFELVTPPAQPAADSGVPLKGEPAPAEGEWYATSVVSGGPNQCRVAGYVNGELYCTRPLGHDADWHVAAGKQAGVLEVWPAKEGDVRNTPTPEMPVDDPEA